MAVAVVACAEAPLYIHHAGRLIKRFSKLGLHKLPQLPGAEFCTQLMLFPFTAGILPSVDIVRMICKSCAKASVTSAALLFSRLLPEDRGTQAPLLFTEFSSYPEPTDEKVLSPAYYLVGGQLR